MENPAARVGSSRLPALGFRTCSNFCWERLFSKDTIGNELCSRFCSWEMNFSNDGGLILVRGLGERLGFGKLVEPHLTERRRGKNTRLPLADLLRQLIYSRLAGYKMSTTPSGSPRIRPSGSSPQARSGSAVQC
jgi:hypothetical protein